MADKEKEEKETKTEDTKGPTEEKTQEKEEIKEETKPVEEKKPKETKKEENKDKPEKPKEQKETEKKPKETKEETKPVEEKKETKDKKPKEKKSEKSKGKKKEEKSDDFQYIVRLSNTDVDGEKKLIYGLTSIKGIGLHMAILIVDEINLDTNKKIGNLSDKEVEKIQNAIDNIQNTAPSWMLNHRKDMESGEDVHLIGPQIEMRLRDEINIMKKIRSYKGIRHERGLRVRGQRTRGNNRSGLTLGVSKSEQRKKNK